jgi:O-succinylbenzoate synthase
MAKCDESLTLVVEKILSDIFVSISYSRRVKFYIYSVIASGQLNARATEFHRQGALIQTDEGGVGCIHPWPELGDATLEEELAALRDRKPLALGKQALECARVDGEARNKGVNLFDGLVIPKSHATLPPSVSPATVRLMGLHGFRAGKVKAMTSAEATAERLSVLASVAPDWRWRLDFNAMLEEREAMIFWRNLSPELRGLIDFVEDPCPFSRESWTHLMSEGMPIACDLFLDPQNPPMQDADTPPIRIIKPAREAIPAKGSGQHVFTSVMDHAIGQLWATWNAAKYYEGTPVDEIPLCGLCTHLLFKNDPFFNDLGEMAPTITPPAGTGLGFDHLLATLPWSPL